MGYTDRNGQYHSDAIGPNEEGSYAPNISDGDRIQASIPIWNSLSGAEGRIASAQADARARRNEDYWRNLANGAPNPQDLAVEYEQEAKLDPLTSQLAGANANTAEQNAAMRALEQMSQEGLTAAERGAMQNARGQQEQSARASRDAVLQQMQARGMSGSGMNLLGQMQSNEDAQTRAANMDAQMLMAAQQRALGAIQSRASLGSQMREQSFNEDATRRSAADQFAQQYFNYQSGREQRNNTWRNQTRESTANSRQQAYQNRERAVAGATNQYSGDADRAQARAAADRQAQQQAANSVGSAIQSIGGLFGGGDDDE